VKKHHAIVAVTVAVILSLVGCGSSGTAARPTTTTQPTTTEAPTTTTTTEPPEPTVYEWYNDEISESVDKLTTAYNAITEIDTTTGDFASQLNTINGYCYSIASAAATLAGGPPPPNPSLEADWDEVMGRFRQGAEACSRTTNSEYDFDGATFQTALNDLLQAVAAWNSLDTALSEQMKREEGTT
jgi:ABC-type glycerol-3-phosphate transport system substrate-binding protein